MKQKFLIGACALAACLGACTNDEFLTEQNASSNVENGAVVGADLVSHGMNIVVNEGAGTRAINGSWENTDQFGMGWYLYQLSPNDGVEASQDYDIWNDGSWDTKGLNDNLYANHKFTYNNGSFVASSDVYQGAYFLYYPFASQSSENGIQSKTIKVNAAEQTGNFAYERFNQALHLSAQDFISADDVMDNGEVLTKEFVLSPAVNVFGVKATAEAGIEGETENINFFKNLNIVKMTIDAGENKNVFASEATLRPLYIPHVKRTAGEIDGAETVEVLDEAAALALQGVEYPNENENGLRSYLFDATMSNELTTEVRNDYTIANAGTDENRIRAFAFPIKEKVTYAADEAPEVKVRVGKWAAEPTVHNTYELGEFTIAGDENKTFNENLVKAFSEDILTKIIRNSAGEWSYANLDATLLLDQFQPLTNDIKSEEQWNDLVKVYDALTEMGVKFETTPVFKLGDDVTFKGVNGTIATPENIDIKLESYPYVMTIDNAEEEIAWPENLLTDGSSVVTVAEGTTLNVGLDDEEINILSEVRNYGLINAGPKAALGSQDGQKVENYNRIIIKYGAYVYPKTNMEGVIAYRLEADNEVAKINKLMLTTAAANNKGIASINTLIVPEGITLDLDAKITEAGEENDRYEADDQDVNDPLNNLDDITIELEGGTVTNTTYGTNASNHNCVKAVIAVKGETSKMVDVQTTEITVKEGKLTIDAIEYELTGKHALTGVKNITNNASLNVLTNVEVENIMNYGQIDVVAEKKMTYSTLNQTNPETGERGSFTGNVVPEEPEVDVTRQNVIDAWEAYAEVRANGKNGAFEKYSEVVDNLKSYGSSQYQAAFLTALNTWLSEHGQKEVTSETITEETLKLFESFGNYSMGLKSE